jgi:hypothetical protein
MLYDDDEFFLWLGITVVLSAGCLVAGLILAVSI